MRKAALCVDLDGTLIRSDLLWESLCELARCRPWLLLWLPLWLLRGRAQLKHELARHTTIAVARLPYNQAVLEHIEKARSEGRPVWLVTGAAREQADAVASHLGLFDQVLASEEQNLVGTNKARKLLEVFGENGYDYIGDSRKDLPAWRQARQAITVNPRYLAKLSAQQGLHIQVPQRRFRDALRALRPHQWLKNLLIFVPLIAAQQWQSSALLIQAALAFVGFSLVASATYLINDLLDLPFDRAHARKRERPLAQGSLAIPHAILAIAGLLLTAMLLSLTLPVEFRLCLAAYFLLTLAYSLDLKRRLLIDVVVLASLYTLRVIAGGLATTITVSHWLFALSIFLFFSLALLKRYTELQMLRDEEQKQASGRGYRVSDLVILGPLGIGSGLLSVLVLALYISSETSRQLYAHSELLWLWCPILLYWISRSWLLCHRGLMHDDPLVFAARDRVSLLLLLLACGILLSAVHL